GLFPAGFYTLRQIHFWSLAASVSKRIERWLDIERFTAISEFRNLREEIVADFDFAWRIFGERNPDGVTEAIAQKRANPDRALDWPILPFPGFSDAQVNGIIPVRPFLIEPSYEQPITTDHHLWVARLH